MNEMNNEGGECGRKRSLISVRSDPKIYLEELRKF
jgi:hypothetical protein